MPRLFRMVRPNCGQALLWLMLAVPMVAQMAAPNSDPMRARIITSDIPNFWRVFDKASPQDAAGLYQREYIEPGSPGLQAFLRSRIENGGALAATVAAHHRYYASIRESTLALDRKPEIKEAIQASFRSLKELYPEAIFPDVYFLIGRMNSAGTTDGGRGLLIGVEMNARDDNTPIDELNNWERAVIGRIANLPNIVAHEVVHVEQRHANPRYGTNGRMTLLEHALNEGGADFLGEMISGGAINRVQREYGDAHERDLWIEFSAAMHGTDASHWLYEGDRAQGRPADMGYYMGFKICEAFYRRAADKKQAILRILAISDSDAFLKESGYGEKFASSGGELR